MSYLNDFKQFWAEVELRAANNYGPFRTREEVEVNINKAIQELAEELKDSPEAIEAKYRYVISELLNTE